MKFPDAETIVLDLMNPAAADERLAEGTGGRRNERRRLGLFVGSLEHGEGPLR